MTDNTFANVAWLRVMELVKSLNENRKKSDALVSESDEVNFVHFCCHTSKKGDKYPAVEIYNHSFAKVRSAPTKAAWTPITDESSFIEWQPIRDVKNAGPPDHAVSASSLHPLNIARPRIGESPLMPSHPGHRWDITCGSSAQNRRFLRDSTHWETRGWLPDLYDFRTLRFECPICFRKQRAARSEPHRPAPVGWNRVCPQFSVQRSGYRSVLSGTKPTLAFHFVGLLADQQGRVRTKQKVRTKEFGSSVFIGGCCRGTVSIIAIHGVCVARYLPLPCAGE
jgi:hypothetical protein